MHWLDNHTLFWDHRKIFKDVEGNIDEIACLSNTLSNYEVTKLSRIKERRYKEESKKKKERTF